MKYKLIWYKQNEVIFVDPKNTTKECSVCGYINSTMKPSIREWTCPECGSVHDRDVNVANNILRKGQEIIGRS
ncbi:MAG: transposase [Methanobrevibacter sp.]|nr:transposase [Candidatus Methanovirga aequatorialis]